jgi:hypothetical protein
MAWGGLAVAGPKTSGGTYDASPLPLPVIDTGRLPGSAGVLPAPARPATIVAPAAQLRPIATSMPAPAPIPIPVRAPTSQPAQASQAATVSPETEFVSKPLLGFVSELRGGVLAHAYGPSVIDSRRESGIDINLEILFAPPPLKFFWYLFEPRPTLGLDINTNGQTTFGYGGFTWEWSITRRLYLDFFLGFAGHDGFLHNAPRDRRELGSRLLFREALELGWRLNERHAVSLMIDHYSNAGYFDKKNQGNDNFGARYSYRY